MIGSNDKGEWAAVLKTSVEAGVAKKKSKDKKSVAFQGEGTPEVREATVRVFYVPSLSEMGKDEVKARWYDEAELGATAKDMVVTVRAVKRQNMIRDSKPSERPQQDCPQQDSEEVCVRGLEHLLDGPEALRLSIKNRATLMRAVLAEQANGDADLEAVRGASERLSEGAVRRARELGASDAAFVRRSIGKVPAAAVAATKISNPNNPSQALSSSRAVEGGKVELSSGPYAAAVSTEKAASPGGTGRLEEVLGHAVDSDNGGCGAPTTQSCQRLISVLDRALEISSDSSTSLAFSSSSRAMAGTVPPRGAALLRSSLDGYRGRRTAAMAKVHLMD